MTELLKKFTRTQGFFTGKNLLQEAELFLDETAELPRGWNGYEAEAPSLATRNLAKAVVAKLAARGVQPLQLSVDVDGGLWISGHVLGLSEYKLGVFDDSADREEKERVNAYGAATLLAIFEKKDSGGKEFLPSSTWHMLTGLTDAGATEAVVSFLLTDIFPRLRR